jgi:hypothetical protein
VDNKESDVHEVEDSSMCQSIVDEMRFSLSKLVDDLKNLEKNLEWQGFLWKRESTRAEAIEKELQLATKEFQNSEIQLDEL